MGDEHRLDLLRRRPDHRHGLLLNLRAGARPVCLFVLAVISGIGVSLVGIFHSSEQNVENGLIAFHLLGAQAVIIAGNVFVLLTGRFGRRVGIPANLARTQALLGIVGLAGFVIFNRPHLRAGRAVR
jgi:hypothetical membrane protein